MNHLLQQIKKRRLALGLKQSDMLLKSGISRQQYQHIESKGNPRLDTLDLIAQGLNSEVVLIPKEKLAAVEAIINASDNNEHALNAADAHRALSDNPWKGLLKGGDDDD